MLKCRCGTVGIPLNDRLPRGWTLKEEGKVQVCPLCSMVEQEKKRKESMN